MFFGAHASSLLGLGLGDNTECWSQGQLYDYARNAIPSDTISDNVLNQIVSAIYNKYQVTSGPSTNAEAIQSDVTSMVTGILQSNYSGFAYMGAGLAIKGVVSNLSSSGYSLVPQGTCGQTAMTLSTPAPLPAASQTPAAVMAAVATPGYGKTAVPVRSVQQAQDYVHSIAPLLSDAQMNMVVKKIMKQRAIYEKANAQPTRFWPFVVAGLGVTFLIGVVTYAYVKRRRGQTA
jgi:hypothetical protein